MSTVIVRVLRETVDVQGLMDTAQKAQAATALQQSGLAPYLLQQQYNAQLAQLQQVGAHCTQPLGYLLGAPSVISIHPVIQASAGVTS